MTHLGGGVTGPGHECPVVGAEAEAHHVPGVPGVHGHLLPRLHVPGGARHVPGARHDLSVVQEAAAGQVPGGEGGQ